MTKTELIRVDPKLRIILEKLQIEIANDIKKKYGLEEITIYGTFASTVLASQHNGHNPIRFKIVKTGLNKGIVKIL